MQNKSYELSNHLGNVLTVINDIKIPLDADDNIPNPPDDPSDNASLLQGDINFTPGGGTSGIQSYSQSSALISLYPNPAINEITINWGENTSNEFSLIKICSLNGQKVKEVIVQSIQNQTKIDVSDLPKGIYILSAISNTANINKKFYKL